MAEHKERITMDDTLLSALVKLAEGNPGAVSACTEMMKVNDTVDPDNIWGQVGVLISLDTYGIYSHYIWTLYKDMCKRSAALSIAMLRAVQMGILPQQELLNSIQYDKPSYAPMALGRIQEVCAALKEMLPNFDKAGEVEKVWNNQQPK